uniref:Uncharacterized protein n=1 Tax=Rhizophora mucronata TaxID=61149 RepID=A0A2P2QG04_RHIMU
MSLQWYICVPVGPEHGCLSMFPKAQSCDKHKLHALVEMSPLICYICTLIYIF